MRPTLAAALLMLWSPASIFGAANDPHVVAERSLAALLNREAGAFEALAHPELVRRIREAQMIRSALAALTGHANKLAHVGAGADLRPEDRVQQGSTSSPSDSEIIALLFSLLDQRYPRNRRIYYVHHGPETVVTSELAIVVFQTTQKDLHDPLNTSSRRTEVFLRPANDGWRLLWAPAIQHYVDPGWDARDELAARVTLTSDARTWVGIVGVRKPSIFRTESWLLPPGDYEIVGTRHGYLDVRWLIHVSSDRQPVSVSVACTQPQK